MIGGNLKPMTDEQKEAYRIASEARKAEQDANQSKNAELKAMAETDETAIAIVAGGGKLWIKAGNARVYLTDDQKLARKGYKRDGKGAVDSKGDRLSNTKTFEFTVKNVYYDVSDKKYYC